MNREQVLRYFTERLATHGPTFRALDWGSAETQRLRFAVLAAVGDLRDASVLDVGCGLGDLWAYLQRVCPAARYEGCDMNPRLVAAAQEQYPAGRFLVADPVGEAGALAPRYDYVLASGLFTLGDEVFMHAMLRAMWARTGRALAFNSLSTWGPRPEPGEHVADPLATVAFCRGLSPRVVLRHDYLAHDFTVYLYRDG